MIAEIQAEDILQLIHTQMQSGNVKASNANCLQFRVRRTQSRRIQC